MSALRTLMRRLERRLAAAVGSVARERATSSTAAAQARGAGDVERNRVLVEFRAAAIQVGDEGSVFEHLATRAAEALDASCAIYKRSRDGRSLDAVGFGGLALLSADERRRMFGVRRFDIVEGVTGRAFTSGEPVFLPDVDDATIATYLGTMSQSAREAIAALDPRTVISVPLEAEDDRIGVLTIVRFGRHAPAFTRDDLAFARELATRASDALTRRALVEQRERTDHILRTMFDASPLATTITDSARNISLWNRAAERLFGFTAAEAIGRRSPIVPEADLADALALGDRIVAGETLFGLPIRRRRKDGGLVDLELYGAPIPDELGGVGLLAIYADVTERNTLLRQLQATSDTLRAILDASPLPIVAVDEAMQVTFWSRAAERVYGWSADEVIGRPAPYVDEAGPEAIDRIFARIARGETSQLEASGRTKDGRRIDVRYITAPLVDEAGRFRGAIGISQDITEQIRLEAELLQAQKMETVGRLAGGVAHDFNNILTAIIGYVEVATEMTNDPELTRTLQTVRSAADRAAALTQQLLAFSRRQRMEPQVVDANEALLGMEGMLRRIIGEDVDLVTSVAPNVGSILVDRTQLEQVILNLAVNARDAMPKGGRLVLRTEATHHRGDHVHAEMPPGDYVVFSVADTGQGMDEETQKHIFEPFFTTKEVGKGTGLGLATTYGIVRQSGGYIWLSSAPEGGTMFKLYFPRVGQQPQTESEPDRPRGDRRGHVLLVEDEPVLRELARRVLAGDGFDVAIAADPAQALSVVHDADGSPFDLLVTDVVMPGTTGIELARRLRDDQPELRVLFMSGYAEDVTDGAGAMPRRFLAKPFTPDSLLRAVDEALSTDAREANR